MTIRAQMRPHEVGGSHHLILQSKTSWFFQQLDLHLKICFEILIKNVLLYGSECFISSIVIIRQELLCMFDPNAVMAATHAAMGGSRWGSLLRGPGRRGVLVLLWSGALSHCRRRGRFGSSWDGAINTAVKTMSRGMKRTETKAVSSYMQQGKKEDLL